MIDPFVYTSDRLRIRFGCGAAASLAAEAEHHGMSRVMLLCSPNRTETARRIAAPLGARLVGVCDGARPGMPAAALDAIVGELERLAADGFVCLGGGSPIGLAKAAAAATKIRFIAMITTYSGSEMSSRWYIGRGADERAGTSPAALPASAIYDPELTLDVPPAISAASGMNAMAHAVESLYGPDANPIVLTLAEEAVRLLGAALPRLAAEPKDLAARTDALYGAWLAAAFRTPVGLSHTLAQRVRQNFGTDHARTHAVMLPYAVAFNRPAAPAAMARMARALGAADPARALYDINVACGLPTGLKDIGLREEDISRAVEIVAKRAFPNPRAATRGEIQGVLEQAFAGRPPRP
jgi:maleylacetate reductase